MRDKLKQNVMLHIIQSRIVQNDSSGGTRINIAVCRHLYFRHQWFSLESCAPKAFVTEYCWSGLFQR